MAPTTQRERTHTDQSDRPLILELTPQELGRRGEEIACTYLEDRGYEIVERNWVCAGGEADIIALDGTDYVLIEVKSRLQSDYCPQVMPELAVTPAKQKRYRDIAACFLAERGCARVRFDVIAVTFYPDGVVKTWHAEGAFGGDA